MESVPISKQSARRGENRTTFDSPISEDDTPINENLKDIKTIR